MTSREDYWFFWKKVLALLLVSHGSTTNLLGIFTRPLSVPNFVLIGSKLRPLKHIKAFSLIESPIPSFSEMDLYFCICSQEIKRKFWHPVRCMCIRIHTQTKKNSSRRRDRCLWLSNLGQLRSGSHFWEDIILFSPTL